MKSARLPFVLALSILLFFLDLGNLGLTDREEGSNAEAAREMLESGEWVTPTLNGEPQFAKSVLVYWPTILAYRLLGVNEFAARFPSACFGVALILLQYWFLLKVACPTVAFFGSLMLLLNIEMVAIGRLALTDSVLIFFTTLSLYGFWLGLHGEKGQRHYGWLFYVGMALGTLAKGPVGFVIPLLVIVPYLTLSRRWEQFRQRGFPLAGPVLFVLIAGPWYAAMLGIHGSRYLTSAQADTVGRFFTIIGGRGGMVLLYVPVLLFGFFPWSGFLPAAWYQVFKRWREARGARRVPPAYDAELEFFAALWVTMVFLFFTALATRLPHYIGPMYPAAAILVAHYWNRALVNSSTPGIRASFRILMFSGYAMGLGLAITPWLYSQFIDTISREFPPAARLDPGLGPTAAGFVLLMGVAGIAYLGLSEERRASAFWAAGATVAVVVLLSIRIAVPYFSRYFIAPPQELAYVAGVNMKPQDRLIFYGPPKPSLLFYARRHAIVIRPGQEDNMRSYLTSPSRTLILLPSRLKPHLPAEAKNFSLLLEHYGYSLLGNEPMVRLPSVPSPSLPGAHGLPQ